MEKYKLIKTTLGVVSPYSGQANCYAKLNGVVWAILPVSAIVHRDYRGENDFAWKESLHYTNAKYAAVEIMGWLETLDEEPTIDIVDAYANYLSETDYQKYLIVVYKKSRPYNYRF